MAFGTVKFMLGFMGDDQISGIITKSQKGLTGLGDSAKKGSRKAKGAFGEIHAALTSTTAKIARVGQAFTGVKSMVSTLGAAIKGAFAFAEQGEAANRVERMFHKLVKNVGPAMAGLREATSNLIDDTTIQANVNRMRMQGAGIKEITELMRISSTMAKVTQEDFTGLARRFEAAIIGGRAASLKLLGVELDLKEALKMKADALGLTVKQLTRQQKVSLKIEAVTERVNDQMAEQGIILESVGGAVTTLNTKWDNFISNLQQNASRALNEVVVELGLIEKSMGGSDIETYIRRFEEMTEAAILAGLGSGEFEQVAANVRHLGEQAGLSAEEIAELQTMLGDTGQLFDDYTIVQKRFSALANRALREQEKGQIKVKQSIAATHTEARLLFAQRQEDLKLNKKVVAWANQLIESADAERKSRGKAAAAAAKARASEAAGLKDANRLTEMAIDGVDRLKIAKQKEADAFKAAQEISGRSESGRALRDEKRNQARLEYLKEYTAVGAAAAKAKEDADKKAAEAGQREIDRLTEIRDDFDRLALDAEADRVDRLSASMLGFGQHVEGAAMSVSSSAPAIAGAFGSIGAVVGIMGDNVGDFAAGVPKSLSALGAITASTTQNVKTQATIQSAFEYAAAIAAGARLDFWGASQHALAGTMFAAVAGSAGGGKKSAGTSAGGGLGAGGLASGGAGSALSSSMASSVTVNVQGLMSGTSADLGVALGESLSDVKTTGLGSRSV